MNLPLQFTDGPQYINTLYNSLNCCFTKPVTHNKKHFIDSVDLKLFSLLKRTFQNFCNNYIINILHKIYSNFQSYYYYAAPPSRFRKGFDREYIVLNRILFIGTIGSTNNESFKSFTMELVSGIQY